MTPSTSKFIDDAQALMLKGHFSEALDGLLTALGVYPDSPDLHRTAAELIYLGMRNGQQEQLTPDRIADNRLDSVFCSCEASECSNSWISAGQFMTETTVTVAKPRGGRCRGCSGYFCRKHYRTRIFSWRCPRCGDRLDGAPRVANGRRPMQTVRLNQPLVHIMVIHEGEQFGPDDIERLLRAVVSDAFEQDGQAEPTVFALPVPRWPDNGEDLALASIAQDYPEYLTDGYAIYIQDGRDQQGVRWLMAKVFAKNPKIVDRDAASRAPRANTNASRSAAEDALHRPVHHSGPDHTDTLTARNNLAHWRGEAGDAAGAAVAFEELLADRLRVLGPDHPHTLAARGNLARCRGKAGDAVGAAAEWEELLAEMLRVKGPDDPDTLAARNKLAYWRGEAGDVAGAAATYEGVLAGLLRVQGPDHPDTLAARNNLAYWRGEAGDAAGAAVAFEELLAGLLRVQGPDHPDTLTARNKLAHWRHTLTARNKLAHWRGEAGDAVGAAAAWEYVLADRLRVLGPDHPDTLATRNNLAHCQSEAGDAVGAAAAYEELLADRLRVLGPDHPDTLATRNNLAHCQSEAGDAVGAAAAYEELLADRLRVLGPDHPDTLATRNNLAQFRHYRLQVERRLGGWANPVHRQTGALVDGCHGVVDASEGELAAIAAQIMERAGGSWHNCRVVFVAGHRRQDEVLRDDEVFGIVAQGDRVLVPGPAHPGFAPATQPPFGPQPRPLGNKPWKDHGLVNRQVVECGSCRGDITVRLAGQDAVLISTPENMRGTAHICGGCGRLLCVDCLVPAVDLAFGSILPKCDRCGENVGPLQAADGQATIFGSPVTNSRTYADHTATEVIDRIVECRRADRHQDRTVQYILDELRREYGHPAYPFAASLERLAYGTAGPALYQESMEPEEAEIVDAVLQRLAGNALRDEPNQ
ncbi:tetratricopeptide repeat protein [Streptomyces sp. NPDC002012]|uniref:tetratricopeptide repeat protein n=1 Tax=Streptomyces sp. NPDC002012 TaxID=3154532 RepID=UPI003331BF66